MADSKTTDAVQNKINEIIQDTIKPALNVKDKTPLFAYVVSKFSGDTEKNLVNAGAYSLMLGKNIIEYSKSHYIVPIASHIMYPNMGLNDNDALDRMLGRVWGLNLMSLCDVVFVFIENNEISSGMKTEIELAKKLEKPIKYVDFDESGSTWTLR